jgi:hypothetical protein
MLVASIWSGVTALRDPSMETVSSSFRRIESIVRLVAILKIQLENL